MRFANGCGEAFYEQELIDQQRQVDRDQLREPTRMPRHRGLTAQQLAVRARLADICSGAELPAAGVVQPPVKVAELCDAGFDHEALKESPAWQLLKYVGMQDAFDGVGGRLEMRNCACRSTICKYVPGGAP